MVVATAAAALSSIQTVYKLAAAAQALKTSTEVRLAIGGMLDELNAAKIAVGNAIDIEFALKQQIRELEEEIRRLEKRDNQLDRYERKRFQPGSVAYALKLELRSDGQPECVCAACYESKQQVISLQPTDKLGSRRYRIHRCPSCKSEFELGPEMLDGEAAPPPPQPERINYPPSSNDAWQRK